MGKINHHLHSHVSSFIFLYPKTPGVLKRPYYSTWKKSLYIRRKNIFLKTITIVRDFFTKMWFNISSQGIGKIHLKKGDLDNG